MASINDISEKELATIFSACEFLERQKILPFICSYWHSLLIKDPAFPAWKEIKLRSVTLTPDFLRWWQPRLAGLQELTLLPNSSEQDISGFDKLCALLALLASHAAGICKLDLSLPNAAIKEVVTHMDHWWDNDETVFSETPKPDPDLEFQWFQHICSLRSLQELHLQNLTFPDQGDALAAIGQLSKLTLLRVLRSGQSRAAGHCTHDQVQCLWKGIGALKALQTLVLENIEVDEHPPQAAVGEVVDMAEDFGQLTELRHLELIDCGYKTLPESMGRLQKLESLRCVGDVEDWSVLSGLSALTSLTSSVANCGRFDGLPQLRKLVVEPALDMPTELTVPPVYGSLWNNLVELDLRGLALRYLPEDVTRMESLETLHLQDNCLSTLPAGKYLDCIRELDLSNNSFTHIPTPLQNAHSLQRLAMRGNDDLEMRQDSLQTLLGLPALQLLDLSKAFCPIDEDFMDMDLCTGWNSTSLKYLNALRHGVSANTRILCNV